MQSLKVGDEVRERDGWRRGVVIDINDMNGDAVVDWHVSNMFQDELIVLPRLA